MYNCDISWGGQTLMTGSVSIIIETTSLHVIDYSQNIISVLELDIFIVFLLLGTIPRAFST